MIHELRMYGSFVITSPTPRYHRLPRPRGSGPSRKWRWRLRKNVKVVREGANLPRLPRVRRGGEGGGAVIGGWNCSSLFAEPFLNDVRKPVAETFKLLHVLPVLFQHLLHHLCGDVIVLIDDVSGTTGVVVLRQDEGLRAEERLCRQFQDLSGFLQHIQPGKHFAFLPAPIGALGHTKALGHVFLRVVLELAGMSQFGADKLGRCVHAGEVTRSAVE